jgi:hypothetical protein
MEKKKHTHSLSLWWVVVLAVVEIEWAGQVRGNAMQWNLEL